MGNKTLFVLCLFFIAASVATSAYVIDGNSVAFEDDHVYVSVFPHTCHDANLDCTFYVNVTSKDKTTLNPTMALVFPDALIEAELSEIIITTETKNGSLEKTTTVSAKNVNDANYDDGVAYKNTISLSAGQTKQYKWNAKLDTAKGIEGKFDLVLWTGNTKSPSWKFVLDPWWNASDTTYWYRFNNSLLDGSGNGNTLEFGGNGNAHNSTYYKTNSYSIQTDGNGNIRKMSDLVNFPSGNDNLTWMTWIWPTTLPSADAMTRIYAMCENMDPPTDNYAFKIGLSNISDQYVLIADTQTQLMNSSNLAGTIDYLEPIAIAVTYNATNQEMRMYANDIFVGNKTFEAAPTWQFDTVAFGDWMCGDGSNRQAGLFDDARLYRTVLTTEELSYWYNDGAGVDTLNLSVLTSPDNPLITNTYEVSPSIGDGTLWQNDPSFRVNTTSATPTVYFQTSAAANCSIGKNNWNYTRMLADDATTKCETTDTVNMSCTLPVTKLLVGNQNMYISCKTAEGYENSTSNSGPLAAGLRVCI